MIPQEETMSASQAMARCGVRISGKGDFSILAVQGRFFLHPNAKTSMKKQPPCLTLKDNH